MTFACIRDSLLQFDLACFGIPGPCMIFERQLIRIFSFETLHNILTSGLGRRLDFYTDYSCHRKRGVPRCSTTHSSRGEFYDSRIPETK